MIGFLITAVGYDTDSKRVHEEKYSGWSEGDPKIEARVKQRAAKMVTELLAKGALKAIGVASSVPLKVADIVSKPLQGMGAAAGEFIAREITKIDQLKVAEYLQLCDVQVSLLGDFEGSYVIKDGADLKKLPTMLELIEGTDGQHMGESVIESMIWAHRNFIRNHCPLSGSSQKRKTLTLELTVEL
jgi:hypothetical protein